MYAFNWIRNHLEEHPETSLPKQEVYDEYKYGTAPQADNKVESNAATFVRERNRFDLIGTVNSFYLHSLFLVHSEKAKIK